MQRILRVRNEAQAILWECELSGQISDGAWENTKNTSWEAWCDADVIVDPDNVGRNFFVMKDSFGFTRRDLLDVVGDRMMGYVRIARGLNLPFGVSRSDLDGLQFLSRAAVSATDSGSFSKYVNEKIMDLGARYDLRTAMASAADQSLYSFEDMLVDLRDLRKIIKVWAR